MIFSFHNKLIIKTTESIHEFYNSVLGSTLKQLSEFKKFNEYISIGNGSPDLESQNTFHLSNHISTFSLSNKSMQSDITKGALFAKYEFIISSKNIVSNITEVGLSDNNPNPTIFNYFSLISNDNPNGIIINETGDIVFEIIIYLNINENNNPILTAGNNPFIEFLLGNGIDDIYITNGSNYSELERIFRTITSDKNLFLCDKTASITNDTLTINFYQKLNVGEINEILFISDNRVFARKNLKLVNPATIENLSTVPSDNYIIKINEDIQKINTVTNSSTQSLEQNYFVSKFANSFGDKINLPFNNLFDATTSRFLSKDSKTIFFVLNDKVFAYKNNDFSISEINSSAIKDEYITNIISFENYVFVISRIFPFISTYIISENIIEKIENNFAEFEDINLLEEHLQIDITQCKNNEFILGSIISNKTALSIYFTYSNNIFTTTSKILNNKSFNYLLAMYKNNFCDGQIIYLKEGESSVECRIVTHSSNSTETDIYSSLAYHLTKDATRIYCKNRAIISEKSTSPSVVIYYYPQIYEYKLPLISNEIKDYISNNLNYIIQEHSNKEFKIYNLVGYNTPEEFSTAISNYINTNEIADFEFLDDTLLIFLNNKSNKIVGFNLNLNKTLIENLSDKTSNYLINYNKYNKLGTNNESVNFSFITEVKL